MIDYIQPRSSYGPGLSEAMIEDATLEVLGGLGYQTAHGPDIAPDTPAAERQSYGDVILRGRLEAAVDRLNPHVPADARAEAIADVFRSVTPLLVDENRRLHRLIAEGVGVQFQGSDGVLKGDVVRLIDFGDVAANDWLAVNQFTVIENRNDRRPDVVVFVNGLPLGVIELKNAGNEAATLDGAYNQLETYKAEIPSLFRTNAVLVISDGLMARVGSLTAERERFMPWRTITGAADDFTPHGPREFETLMRGVFAKDVLLEIIRDFTVFGDKGKGPFKIIGGYHQFHGGRKALAAAVAATRPEGDRRIGVIWHTQGSGKSLLMAFFAGLAVRHPLLANPTLVILTDRNDLDDQLFGTFSLCKDLLRQTPEQAADREDLRRRLDRASGGVIFTTVQKFLPEKGEEDMPVLTARRNVIVIADEAHRSQYGFDARLNRETGQRRYGFAHYIRQALPNASFIGFTGTPIEAEDVNTPAIFGDYIDIYDISRAVEDEATVPIYYESRLARIELDEAEKPRIDAEIEALVEDDELSMQERQKAKWSAVERLVGAEKRLKLVAEDMVRHLEARLDGMGGGKAMAVGMSRQICVDLYRHIVALRPDWHADDHMQGAAKIVMTGNASDPAAFQPHVTSKKERDAIANRARDPDDPLKLVIVRDMWLTGFDAPCMHTMYVDKPMRGHGLMQAIARVNRVFRDKTGGLIVDYIGIGERLKGALGDYTSTDREKTGIDEEAAVAAMVERYEIVRAIFHGHDYSKGITGAANERLAALADAIEWVVAWQKREADKAKLDAEKKRALRGYQDAVLALSKAFALASASEAARQIRDEVGFFQAVRAALVKTSVKGKLSEQARMFAVGQLINQAIASTEIVDILAAAGISQTNLSVLSDEFLLEVQRMERKNLALEALRKLLNGEIKSRSQTNVVESRKFSERLEDAVARYHANALSTVEVLQELIKLAQDMRAAAQRGEDLNLTREEVAFYDALADNQSAVEVMGDEQLRVIAAELLTALRTNVTVDWRNQENARARMRTLVKRILRKYGYPPDLQDGAVRTVIEQAERILSEIAPGAT
ncbi:MAG: type I restriction endonuclease subunit R [Hyphomicrobiaceae bacterium]